ncbi:MAG: hypothetical protein AB1656_19980 [Candidatus Omnitrophota bacterium]
MRRCASLALVLFIMAIPVVGDDAVREYTANKVKGTPPVIDGNYTDAGWAGSEWTGEFFGLRNGAVGAAYQGQKVDVNYQWRALWDEDYLYILMTADFYYLTPNGWTYAGDIVTALAADDTGYAGWGVGTCVDFEFFLEPNWKDGDGYNSNPPAYTEATNGGGEPSYQLCYFPLIEDREGDKVWEVGNFGVRDKDEGPPFFYTGVPAGLGGNWMPIFDAAYAQSLGAKPMKLAALPHEIAGAKEGQVVATPVLEIAVPFSQLNLTSLMGAGDITAIAPAAINCVLEKDADGHWVKPGDEWLINITGYTDGYTAGHGASLVTWNNVVGGGFRTYPRGILRFAAGTSVENWMLN